MSAPPQFKELAEFLEGELTQARAAEVEAHVAASAEVRAELEQARAMAQRLGEADPAVDAIDLLPRLHAALARPAPAAGRSRWPWWFGSGIAVGAVAVLLAIVSAPLLRGEGGFRVKGPINAAPTRWAGIEAYRVENGRTVGRADPSMRATQGLAFAYRNGGPHPFTYLAVFAVDGSGSVFWYYPAWERPGDDPASIGIGVSETAVLLPDAVRHAYAPGPIHVHALFTRQPLHVSDIESRVRSSKPGAPLELPDAVDPSFDLRVDP